MKKLQIESCIHALEVLTKKKVKLVEDFGNLNEVQIIDKIYRRIFESEMFDEYTSGELAALTRGLEITTEPQLAAAYLMALGKTEGETNKFLQNIVNVENNTLNIKDFAEPNGGYTADGIADAVGANGRTLNYCLNKFANLINDIGETPSQSLSPKIIGFFDKFRTMNVAQIGQIAGEALQPKENSKNRDAAVVSATQATQQRTQAKTNSEELGRQAYMMARDIKKAFNYPQEKAIQKAAEKIAAQKNILPEKVKKAIEQYMKNHTEGKLI